MPRYKKQKARMKLTTLKHIEETDLRVRLRKESQRDNMFRLQLLTCFRQDATLRQINNARQINFH